MNELFDFPLNPVFVGWTAIIGFFITIMMAIRGIIAWRWDKQEPCWTVRTFQIISGQESLLHELQVRYRGKIVESLAVSEVTFWNNGRRVLHGDDIAAKDRLRITAVNDVRILEASVVEVNNIALDPIVDMSSVAEKEVLLNFDYLEKGWAFKTQIIHDGKSDQDITVQGSIKGVSGLRHITFSDSHLDRRLIEERKEEWMGLTKTELLLFVTLSGAITNSVLLSSERADPSFPETPSWYFVLTNGLFVVVLLGVTVAIWKWNIQSPLRPPSGLRPFTSPPVNTKAAAGRRERD
jgi:hypothetical protein